MGFGSLCAIAGVLLSAAGCAVDDPLDADDQTDPAVEPDLGDTAPSAAVESPSSTGQGAAASALSLAGPGATTNACRTTCRDVVHPELCLVVPFPFCLIPQHECVTLCDVP
jgi:hypothetical protein